MPTLPELVRQNAARIPAHEALVAGDRRRTWAEVHREVELLAGALHRRGLRPGDRCAVMAGNTDEFVLAHLAALRAGAIAVPVNVRLAVPEIGHLVRDSGCRLLVADDASLASAAAGAAAAEADTSRLEAVIAVGELLEDRGGEGPALEVGEDDDAIVLYTSGTTGVAKGVLHDHRRLLWTGLSQVPICGLSDRERYLHVAPLYHGAGITFITAICAVGGCQVILPAFDPAIVLQTLERERITGFLGVPTMLQVLLRQQDIGERDLSSWRYLAFGAAPMPASAIRELSAVLPHVALVQQCGQTEAGPSGIYATDAQTRERPDASGRQAMPWLEARIVDADDGDVAPGEVGELLLRGPTVMKGYWQRPEATAEALREGWLHTGDLLRLDADGYMTVVDRMKDMIITGGRNVYCVEVERALASHSDIADVAVIGRPHEVWGESIVAVVAVRPGASLDLDEVREHARPLIADYKLPHELHLADVPRNAAGKADKKALRALAGVTRV